jgi:hypothetical protein
VVDKVIEKSVEFVPVIGPGLKYIKTANSVSFTCNYTLHLTKITIKFVNKLKLKNIDPFNNLKSNNGSNLSKHINVFGEGLLKALKGTL